MDHTGWHAQWLNEAGGYNNECKVYTDQACFAAGLAHRYIPHLSLRDHHSTDRLCCQHCSQQVERWLSIWVEMYSASSWCKSSNSIKKLHTNLIIRQTFYITLVLCPVTFKGKPCWVSICVSVLNLWKHHISQFQLFCSECPWKYTLHVLVCKGNRSI